MRNARFSLRLAGWLAAAALTVLTQAADPLAGLQLTEFLADNQHGLRDDDGDVLGWVELYNGGAQTLSLSGAFLTDDASNLAKWRFPAVSLMAGEYLVVFASGKDRTNDLNHLHTNFKPAKQGGYLALVSPATNVLSAFTPNYPAQFPDASYGRARGEPTLLGYFFQPTPGKANASEGAGFAPAVNFSPPGGTFTDAFTVELSSSSAAAVIRYTLDGNLPTNGSPVYSGPLTVTTTVQVRARAYQEGLLPGPPRSETYFQLGKDVLGFTSTLPVLVVHTLGKGAPTSGRYLGAALAFHEPVNGVTSLTNPPTLITRGGLRVRGSSTEGLPQPSYAMELWDDFSLDQHHAILGLPAESDWVLYAPNVFEPVMIHNPFIHQLSRDMGRYSPRTRFLEVYLARTTGAVTSTAYYGIYVLEEKIKVGKHRVDIDRMGPTDLKAPEVSGGYLLKIDRLDPGDVGVPGGGVTMGWVEPKEAEVRLPQRAAQRQYVTNFFTTFSRAVTGVNFRDPILGYRPFIDVGSWVDYHVLEVLSGNVDALVLSTYFHKPRGGKITFGPHWDFDRALGSTDGRDTNPRSWSTGPFFSASWWTQVLRDVDFWQQWVDRWQDLRQSTFSLTNLHGLIDRMSDELREAQPRQVKKWSLRPRGGTYQAEINLMKNWVSNRVDMISTQLVAKPVLNSPGGFVAPGFGVTLTIPRNATVYYTVDGTDPRLPQGAVSPNAKVYTDPIQVQANIRVVARARNLNQKQSGGPPATTPWSGPAAATFVVTPLLLLPTEIMFHPAAPPAGGTHLAEDFQFLELKNAGPAAIELAGFHFTKGITFAFTAGSGVTHLAPGERLVLVRNLAAFQERYPGVKNIAGVFSGDLAAAGGLALVGPLLEPVFDFTPGAAGDRLADGLGFSLVLADESLPPSQLGEPAHWRLSAAVGGSPGGADPAPATFPRVVVNEVLSRPLAPRPDALELFNPQAEMADLSGWFLSDDPANPKKYRVPDGTRIDGQGYLVFDKSQFGGGPLGGFALSAGGDSVFLFSADAQGNLSGYDHGFQFGAADPGVSFGRFVTSDGVEHFVPQVSATLGQFNAGPRLSPVLISEVMFDAGAPASSHDPGNAFIELHNASASAMSLWDATSPTNTWHVRGSVDLELPTNTTLLPGGRLVLVGFNPRTELARAGAFRARYLLDPRTTLVGPWRGQLDSAGGVVRLLATEQSLSPPSPAPNNHNHVLAEELAFPGPSPWPSLGLGLSLQRRDPRAFAGEPAAWTVGAPNPGDADSDGDGLPDSWEIAHGLDPHRADGLDGAAGDPDGDGVSNGQEYLSGTDPQDGGSALRLEITRGEGSALNLGFVGAPGRKYSVLYRTNLITGPWLLWRAVSPATAGPVWLPDSPTNAARAYRLRLP